MSPRRTNHAEIVSFETSTHFDVEVMRTWYRAQEFARHSHAYFTIGLMRSGIGTLWSDGVTHSMRRGDVVIIPPGEVHTGGLDANGGVLSYIALHVPSEHVPGVDMKTTVLRDRDLAGELRRVDAAVEARDSAAVEAGAVAAIARLAHLGESSPTGSSGRGEPEIVRIARTIIDDCFADNNRTSLASLAAETRVSAFHLVREFKRSIGLSPHQYIIQTRVRRAAELLARGDGISDTAAAVGFSDQAHLTMQFRRHLGATPALWKRGRRG